MLQLYGRWSSQEEERAGQSIRYTVRSGYGLYHAVYSSGLDCSSLPSELNVFIHMEYCVISQVLRESGPLV